ncbi:RDD family protein [Trueperella pyogenes]|uniref:RDD family protein n=1 Tax=Trueperella pyogenes TaxID=1661 RepID=UPI000F854B0D|nr:RDD family protein [Trueperella pyogenes]AZR00881.1 RDD family protein [Trueperella pyogenes]AZR02128.1 RDD family protein [Trueperella pyogenes]
MADSIITGEGVELELPAATVLSRILAGLIDYGLLAIIVLTLLKNFIGVLELNSAQARTGAVVAIALFFWLVPALITASFNGRSLGKIVTRTRVVGLDGATITTNQAFVRATVGIAEIYLSLGLLATITAFASRRGQRLGDMLAGTYVVRWPSRRVWEPEVSMPRELATWADVAHTRPLPTGLTLNMADFLKSRTRLTPQARQAQARALAAACERYVYPPPAWGTPPEDFIEAMTVLRYQAELSHHSAVIQRRASLSKRIEDAPYGLAAATSEGTRDHMTRG